MKAETSDSGKTRALIENCRKGDQRAQFEVYRLYYKAMYNTCLRLVNQVAEAEDVMQEAFLSAFRKIDSYKGEVSFGAWLKKIVINKSIDVLRQRRMKFEPLDQDHTGSLAEPTPESGEVDQPAERMVAQIKEAINMLPDGYRIVITLALIEGYDHEEIAQILGISQSASRSQLARARIRLMEYLRNKQVWTH